MKYRLLVDFEVIEILDGLPSKVSKSIRAQIGKLRSAPESFSDYSEYDRSGRQVGVNVFGGYCIHYWIDSADRHIKVMELTLADR